MSDQYPSEHLDPPPMAFLSEESLQTRIMQQSPHHQSQVKIQLSQCKFMPRNTTDLLTRRYKLRAS